MVESVPAVTVVVLAFGEEPLLADCVAGALASTGVEVTVVLVDNGCTMPDQISGFDGCSRVHILEPGRNLGFAAGVNLGVSAGRGDYVVLLNSDAVPDPDAISAMVDALDSPDVGLVTASLRLLHDPQTMNSAGNPVHFSGLSWAGGLYEPASVHAAKGYIASASGAALACRRSTWERLGGLCEEMFAYHEDTDLSLRCWLAGWSVVYVPEAVVYHAYEFSRNPDKMGLLERNRLITILSIYESRSLFILGPALLALEGLVAVLALRDRWFLGKFRGWLWVLENLSWIRERRREIQRTRTISDAELARLFIGEFTAAQYGNRAFVTVLSWFSRKYWCAAKKALA